MKSAIHFFAIGECTRDYMVDKWMGLIRAKCLPSACYHTADKGKVFHVKPGHHRWQAMQASMAASMQAVVLESCKSLARGCTPTKRT
jgi:hypothetical protein